MISPCEILYFNPVKRAWRKDPTIKAVEGNEGGFAVQDTQRDTEESFRPGQGTRILPFPNELPWETQELPKGQEEEEADDCVAGAFDSVPHDGKEKAKPAQEGLQHLSYWLVLTQIQGQT